MFVSMFLVATKNTLCRYLFVHLYKLYKCSWTIDAIQYMCFSRLGPCRPGLSELPATLSSEQRVPCGHRGFRLTGVHGEALLQVHEVTRQGSMMASHFKHGFLNTERSLNIQNATNGPNLCM